MTKNVIIAVLAVLVLAEAAAIATGRGGSIRRRLGLMASAQTQSSTTNTAPSPTPFILSKGMKLSETPISKNTYKIAPGDLSDDAKKAISGWKMLTQINRDGSEIVTLTPTDSDDQKQQYTLAKGNMLYFVESFPGDDQNNKDQNLRDDYGIITDATGVVQ